MKTTIETRERNRPPAHPGRILKNLYLAPLGISNTRLAEALISDVLAS